MTPVNCLNLVIGSYLVFSDSMGRNRFFELNYSMSKLMGYECLLTGEQVYKTLTVSNVFILILWTPVAYDDLFIYIISSVSSKFNITSISQIILTKNG